MISCRQLSGTGKSILLAAGREGGGMRSGYGVSFWGDENLTLDGCKTLNTYKNKLYTLKGGFISI